MDHSRLRASPEQRQQEQEDAIADRVRRSGLGTAAAATRCARRATYQQDAGHKADEYEEKIASSDDHEVTSHYGMRGLPGSSLRLRQGDELPPRSRANARLRGDSDDDGLQGHITHDMADDRGATVFKQAYSANASLVSHYEPSQYTSLVPRVQQHETTAPLYGVHGYAGQSAFSKTSMGFLMAQGEQIETYEAPASSEVPHNINSLDARKRRVASSTSGRQYSVTQAADDDLFEVKPSGLEAAHFLPIRSASYPGSIMDAVSHEARPPSSMTTRQQRHSHELTRLSLPPLPSRQETERTTESATAAGHESKPSKEKRRSRECKVDGCPNYIINRGLCFRHGGGRKCSEEGCASSAKNAGKCWKHGGSVKCLVETCTRKGKSRGVCWAHGGGTMCSLPSCEKVAVSNGFCWAHGGGKRCAFEGCNKAAYKRTHNYCVTHHALLKDGNVTLEV